MRKSKRLIAALLTTALLLLSMPTALAATNLSDTASQSGTGWVWDHSTLTLTVSENITLDAISLPDGAKIGIASGKTLAVKSATETAITGAGKLSISGGKLVVEATAEEAYGISAETVVIENIDLAIDSNSHGISALNVQMNGVKMDIATTAARADGIHAESATNDVSIALTNCSGTIDTSDTTGRQSGIDAAGASVSVTLKNCDNLTVSGSETEGSPGVEFYRCGIRLRNQVTGSYNVALTIEDCDNLTVSGGIAAIALDVHTNTNSKTPATLTVKNSSVLAKSTATCYAGIFVNNNGKTGDADAAVNIIGSDLQVEVPNATGIMISTAGTETNNNVKIKDSLVQLDAKVAGIRAYNNGANGNAGISLEDSVLASNTGDSAYIAEAKYAGKSEHDLSDMDAALVIAQRPSSTTATLYDDATIGYDYAFPTGTKFVKDADATISVAKGVTVTIDGVAHRFPYGGELVISEDGSVEAVPFNINGVPETADTGRPILWLSLALLCTLALAIDSRKRQFD